jgi:hypothetical protein
VRDTPADIRRREESIRDNPPEVIPEIVIVRREVPVERPKRARCPTCGHTLTDRA